MMRRRTRYFTPVLALSCAACVTGRAVAPMDLRRSDAITVQSERSLLVHGTTPANRSVFIDCPVESVSGRIARIAGDSVWLESISSMTRAADAPAACRDVNEGVLVLSDMAGIELTRSGVDGKAVAVIVLVAVVMLGAAIFTSGGLGIPTAPAL